MIHYIYKIIFLRGYPCGRYYLGKRSYKGNDLAKDKYRGSGVFCKLYFKKYGAILGDTYLKEIIEINPSFEINRDREEVIIGDLWKSDPLCMNQCPGGLCGIDSQYNNSTKPVLQYDLWGNYITEYKSQSEASQITNISNSTISSVCRRKGFIAGGYIWRFKDDPLTRDEWLLIEPHIIPIKQYDLSLNYIKTWSCGKEIERCLNICSNSILVVCKHSLPRRFTAGGYIWSFYNKEPVAKNDLFFGNVKVAQYSLDGNYITSYNSYKEAANAVGATWQSIQRVCNGKRKSTKGFIWKKL